MYKKLNFWKKKEQNWKKKLNFYKNNKKEYKKRHINMKISKLKKFQ